MIIGTYTDGRRLDYDEPHFQFSVQGVPLSLADVKAADADGLITWSLPEQRTWLYSIDEDAFIRAHAAAVETPQPGVGTSSATVPDVSYVATDQTRPGVQIPAEPNVEFVTTADPSKPPKKKLNTALVVIIIVVATIAISCGVCAIGSAIVTSNMDTSDLENELQVLDQQDGTGYDGYDSTDNSFTDDSTGYTSSEDELSFYQQDVTFQPQTYTGTGDQIINLPDDIPFGIIRLVSSDSPVETSWVNANDSSVSEMQKSPLIGSYLFYTDTAYCEYFGETTADGAIRDDIKVYSTGSWTIEVLPINDASVLSGATSGTGYEVLKAGVGESSWTFTAASDNQALLVETLDGESVAYLRAGESGTVTVNGDSGYILVMTEGAWSVTPSTT